MTSNNLLRAIKAYITAYTEVQGAV